MESLGLGKRPEADRLALAPIRPVREHLVTGDRRRYAGMRKELARRACNLAIDPTDGLLSEGRGQGQRP
jgi:hypothetical protein